MPRTALGEVQRFVGDHPEARVFLVDVRGARPLSMAAAARLGVQHESPQVILVRNGTAAWHASHFAVTAHAIAEHFGT